MSDDKLVEAVARAIYDDRPEWSFGKMLPYPGERGRTRHMRAAQAALSAIESHGYRVVPVEPTEKMADEGTTAFHRAYFELPIAREVWTAMLSACPKVG